MGIRTLAALGLAAAAGTLLLGLAPSARASGPAAAAPWYLDPYGGETAQMGSVYGGQPGIVMARSPRPLLYLDWRLLHGQAVGPVAGPTLTRPCCDAPWLPNSPPAGAQVWQAARLTVKDAPERPPFIETARPGPNFTSRENCFPEAFETAAATLNDRMNREGGATPAVRAWLATQDAVFDACARADAVLPPPVPAAPAWLKADRAYQEAAFALYMDRDLEAADRFAAIGRDKASPWRRMGPYLQARALLREARSRPSPDAWARAEAAIAALARLPADAYGRGRAEDLRHVLLFRAHPDRLGAEIATALAAHDPPPHTDVLFRDLSDLFDAGLAPSDALDWMTTLRARHTAAETEAQTTADGQMYGPDGTADLKGRARAGRLRLQTADAARRRALDHARQRWTDSHDPAWLLAALSLAVPGDPEAQTLIAAGSALAETDPAWLTVQLHLVRLALAADTGAQTEGETRNRLRARLDALIARPDLRVADRNLFRAQRLQLARDLPELVQLALRQRICGNPVVDLTTGAGASVPPQVTCLRDNWPLSTTQYGGVFDQEGQTGTRGLGEDARAVIDRMPLAQRLRLAEDKGLPELIRRDIALTNYARAVALQAQPAIDRTARQLVSLLPVMADDFLKVAATPPGPDKRFAAFVVLAKIPGLRMDLVAYTRPEKTVAEFQGAWMDWVIRPAAAAQPDAAPPPLAAYQQAGEVEEDAGDPATDLVCLGACSPAPSPLRLPGFVAAAQGEAKGERAVFAQAPDAIYGRGETNPARTLPPGAVAVWDEMLDYVSAHRQDPRAAETLYWLVHVGHFGGSHNHSGRRAFRLLKTRYPQSDWAVRTRYYFD
jgi:hypothetical protein